MTGNITVNPRLLDWTQGTVSVTNGSTGVTFSGAGLVSTDATTGAALYACARGDILCVGTVTAIVGAVVDANDITLMAPWTGSTLSAQAYSITRLSVPATGQLAAAINSVLSAGSAANPMLGAFVDDGTARVALENVTGTPTLAVGATGAATGSLKNALQINPTTGVVSAPAGGFNFQQSVGNRTRLRNASFAINRRAVTGTVTLAAGAYGHDGVKGGASGCTYTFSTTGLDTTITISAGSLILPIEAAMIEGGSYTASQAGGAQARVWQGTGSTGSGAYATAPFTVTGLTAATQTNLEFSTGTVLRPQLEPGVIATAFERRPPSIEMALCQRYFMAWVPGLSGIYPASGVFISSTLALVFLPLPVHMLSAPTLTSSAVGTFAVWSTTTVTPTAIAMPGVGATYDMLPLNITVSGVAGQGLQLRDAGGSSFIYASAEI